MEHTVSELLSARLWFLCFLPPLDPSLGLAGLFCSLRRVTQQILREKKNGLLA